MDEVMLTFDADYAAVAEGLEDYFAAACYNELFSRFMDRVTFDNFQVTQGLHVTYAFVRVTQGLHVTYAFVRVTQGLHVTYAFVHVTQGLHVTYAFVRVTQGLYVCTLDDSSECVAGSGTLMTSSIRCV